MDTTSDFVGWVAEDPTSADGNMSWKAFTPKPFEDTDIEIDITHCGICGSDIHHLRSGWKPADYPIVVGHEIIGKVTQVGSKVKDIAPDDRVGVGAQTESCHNCERCHNGLEQYCKGTTITYDARYPSGAKAFGGYANKWRGPSSFVFQIPDNLASEVAAPMLCAGLTVWQPLRDHGAGPGKRVGVIGIGGLGHSALSFAKALQCDVVAISRTSSKKEDAFQLGATSFIATDEESGWASKYAESLDLIICTVSGAGLPMAKYLQLLDVKGTLVQVGAPEDPIPAFSAFSLIAKGVSLCGNLIGNRQSMREMLDFAAENNVQARVQVRSMSDANKAVVDMEDGKAQFRYVLTN